MQRSQPLVEVVYLGRRRRRRCACISHVSRTAAKAERRHDGRRTRPRRRAPTDVEDRRRPPYGTARLPRATADSPSPWLRRRSTTSGRVGTGHAPSESRTPSGTLSRNSGTVWGRTYRRRRNDTDVRRTRDRDVPRTCHGNSVTNLWFNVRYTTQRKIMHMFSTSLLSTHTDRQRVDVLFTVCFVCVCVCRCVCVFVRLRITPARVNLAASNFARWFIVVLGRESLIFGNFFSQKPKIGRIGARRQVLPTDASPVHWRRARGARPGTPSACVDIRPSPKTHVVLFSSESDR